MAGKTLRKDSRPPETSADFRYRRWDHSAYPRTGEAENRNGRPRSVKQAKICSEVAPAAAAVVEDEHALVVQILGAVEAEHLAGASIGNPDAVVTPDYWGIAGRICVRWVLHCLLLCRLRTFVRSSAAVSLAAFRCNGSRPGRDTARVVRRLIGHRAARIAWNGPATGRKLRVVAIVSVEEEDSPFVGLLKGRRLGRRGESKPTARSTRAARYSQRQPEFVADTRGEWRRIDGSERELERLLLSSRLQRHLLECPQPVRLELLPTGHRRLLDADHRNQLLAVVEHLRGYVNVQPPAVPRKRVAVRDEWAVVPVAELRFAFNRDGRTNDVPQKPERSRDRTRRRVHRHGTNPPPPTQRSLRLRTTSVPAECAPSCAPVAA